MGRVTYQVKIDDNDSNPPFIITGMHPDTMQNRSFKMYRNTESRKLDQRIIADENDRIEWIGKNYGDGSMKTQPFRYMIGIVDHKDKTVTFKKTMWFDVQTRSKCIGRRGPMAEEGPEVFGTGKKQRALKEHAKARIGKRSMETMREEMDEKFNKDVSWARIGLNDQVKLRLRSFQYKKREKPERPEEQGVWWLHGWEEDGYGDCNEEGRAVRRELQEMDMENSGNGQTSRKGGVQAKDDPTTFHSHIQDEHVVEVSPNERYGRLNTILGKGAYKIVWKALDFEEGLEVAWNSFQTTKQESADLSEEIEILMRVRHPNIIGFRDSWYSNGEFVFITELMNSGTLGEYRKKFSKLNLDIIKDWSRQILKGLLYLHSQNPPIIHRDLKCDNVFINGAHGEVKIGDLGIAKMKIGKKYTVIGTPEFMAPEMFDESGYNEKVDVYAFGMCLLELATGERPYGECKNPAQIYKKVIIDKIKPECISRVENEDILSLVHRCLASEHERITVREIFDHPLYAYDPDVVLLSVDELRYILTLQVVFRGQDRMSVKFEYHLDSDTADNVVEEMIEEKVLPAKFKSFVVSEINRIIREFHQKFPFAMEAIRHNQQMSEEGKGNRTASILSMVPPVSQVEMESNSVVFGMDGGEHGFPSPGNVSWKRDSQYKSELVRAHQEMILARERAKEAEQRTKDMEDLIQREERKKMEAEMMVNRLKHELERAHRMDGKRDDNGASGGGVGLFSQESLLGYESGGSMNTSPTVFGMGSQMEELGSMMMDVDMPVENLVRKVAQMFHRSPEKAEEWAAKLREQDIVTVGDLEGLEEDDWGKLNLTVFACRVLRNAINKKRELGLAKNATSPSQETGENGSQPQTQEVENVTAGVSELEVGDNEEDSDSSRVPASTPEEGIDME